MNEQYEYIGQRLTPKMTQELILELLEGETLRRREIIGRVDEAHKGRGGYLATGRSQHPVVDALAKMKRLGLVESPILGFWSILPAEETSESEEASESKGTAPSEEKDEIKTLDGFMEWARRFESGKYVFRGVPNAAYGIQASAFRRPEEKKRDFEKFLQINQDLIREARLRGYDGKDGRELKELEILADLQHFGAATCLIDFSHSAQIALWFACERDHKNAEDSPDGKVFAVSNQPPRFKEITPTLLKEDIGYFLKDGEESQLYHWQPRQQNHRIIAQQSIFLFGNYEFIAEDVRVIAAESKQVIRSELEKISGITKDRMFPDFEGFAVVRSEEVPYTELTPSEFKERGFLAYEREDYRDAISDFDRALNLNDTDHETYYLRGRAKSQLGLYSEAVDDYTDAIKLKHDAPDYHFRLGMARYNMEKFDEAKESFSNAVGLDSNIATYHEMNGHACYKIGKYEEAIDYFGRAVNLQSNELLSANLYYWRGMAKFNIEKHPEAIDDLILAINLKPQEPKFYHMRGIVKRRMENFDGANDDFRMAVKFAVETENVSLVEQINQDLMETDLAQLRILSRASGQN